MNAPSVFSIHRGKTFFEITLKWMKFCLLISDPSPLSGSNNSRASLFSSPMARAAFLLSTWTIFFNLPSSESFLRTCYPYPFPPPPQNHNPPRFPFIRLRLWNHDQKTFFPLFFRTLLFFRFCFLMRVRSAS